MGLHLLHGVHLFFLPPLAGVYLGVLYCIVESFKCLCGGPAHNYVPNVQSLGLPHCHEKPLADLPRPKSAKDQ